MIKLKLTTIGTATGALLPDEMLTRLQVETGDILYAVETKDGYLITPHDPDITGQVDAGRQFMQEYEDTFTVLAQ